MKKTFLIIFFSSFIISNCSSQTWSWLSNLTANEDDYSTDIVVDNIGNSYICGTFENYINFNAWPPLVLNASIGEACGGNIINSFIAKYSSQGDVIWAKQVMGKVGGCNFGSHSHLGCSRLAIDENANIYVLGMFGDTTILDGTQIIGNDSSDTFMAKLDSSGNLIWSKIISANDFNEGADIAYNHNGKIIISCTFYSDSITLGDTTLHISSPSQNCLLATFDTAGNFNSAFIPSTTISVSPYSFVMVENLATDTLGNIYFAGFFRGNLLLDTTITSISDHTDIIIAKIDSNYHSQWATLVDGTDHSNVPISVDNEGNSYITDRIISDTLLFDTMQVLNPSIYWMRFISKINSIGRFDWTDYISNDAGFHYAKSLFNSSDGNIFMVGEVSDTVFFSNHPGFYYSSKPNGYGNFLVCYDSTGAFQYTTANQRWDGGRTIAGVCDFNNDVIITGSVSNASGSCVVGTHGFSGQEVDIYTTKLSNIPTRLSENNFINKISLFPNPSHKEITVSYPISSKQSNLSVTDLTGKICQVQIVPEHSSQLRLDISKLANGFYFITINSDKFSLKGKFIKE